MNGTTAVAPRRIALALTLIRLIVGIVFLVHGSQKLFVFGIGGITGFFSQMGIPLPMIAGPVVTFVELLGGIALILGIFTRVAAILLAIDMCGAILFVHGKNGFFLPNGFEYALTLLTANIALAIGGPGEYAVESRFMGRGV
ncbi:MAG TPA: DoxX family protein [Gemmatimonadaceae bacterium]|jgi:putative oxidoreductase